jgi:hypothetical protein
MLRLIAVLTHGEMTHIIRYVIPPTMVKIIYTVCELYYRSNVSAI